MKAKIQQKFARASGSMAVLMAKQQGDKLFDQLRKAEAIVKLCKKKILGKYGSKAKSAARKIVTGQH